MKNTFIANNKTYFVNESILSAPELVKENSPLSENVIIRCKYNENGTAKNELIPYWQAQSIANESDLQLVSFVITNGNKLEIISEVCDASKIKFADQKRQQKQKQNTTEVHIIQISPNINTNDLNIKVRKALDEVRKKQARIQIKCPVKVKESGYPEIIKAKFVECVQRIQAQYDENPVPNKVLSYSEEELAALTIPKWEKSNKTFDISLVNA